MMTDLYIETPTQADYDALIRLAKDAGFEWASGNKMNEEPNNYLDEREETVIHLDTHLHKLWYDNLRRYEDKVIEAIPNLAKIKVIWKVGRENRDAFTMKHLLPPHYKSARNLYIICDEYSGTYTTKENEIYEALAVEYKPKESEKVMNKKVKLPKFVCDWLDQNKEEFCGYPMTDVSMLSKERDTVGAVKSWLVTNTNTQWKLIDALRYGYEPEPEQLYYVWFVRGDYESFLNVSKVGDKVDIMIYDNDDDQSVNGYRTTFTMKEIEAIDPRYKPFAVPVEEVDGDMNEEGRDDD